MAIDSDDLEPQRRAKPALKDLTALGVAELKEYIAGLEAEIARARQAIAAKEAQRNAADAFFKKP